MTHKANLDVCVSEVKVPVLLFVCSHLQYHQLKSQLPKEFSQQQEYFVKQVSGCHEVTLVTNRSALSNRSVAATESLWIQTGVLCQTDSYTSQAGIVSICSHWGRQRLRHRHETW